MLTLLIVLVISYLFALQSVSRNKSQINMSKKITLVFTILMVTLSVNALIGPIPTFLYPKIKTHPQHSNAEKWIDYMQGTPIGKLFRVYTEAKEVGLPVEEFTVNNHPDALKDKFNFK